MIYNYSILNNNNDDIDNIKDVKSFLIYVVHHYEKFLLFLLVCIIIYLVDYLSNINAVIYGAPQIIPGLTNISNSSTTAISKNIIVKKQSATKRSRNKK